MLSELQKAGEAPAWMDEAGYQTLSGGYLLPGETPRDMYLRVARAAARYEGAAASMWEQKFFDAMWKNWLCPATPVLSNLGTLRGLPISCNSIHVGDSVDSIFTKAHELAMLTKNGAGVGVYLGDVRARGTKISGNGSSEGLIPWAKVFDSTIVSVSQGSTRRGASALYIPIDHGDADEFISIRRPTGDINRRTLNLNHGFTITDAWMRLMLDGDSVKRNTWQNLLKTRVETGQPYLFFVDNTNKSNPECYKQHGLEVKTSNICTEICLFTDVKHTFVCCLSSLNLVRFSEWKETDLVQTSIRFLDNVLQEYIDRSQDHVGLEPSRRSAIKGRALGLGVLGWHSLLQERGYAFDSFQAMSLNAQVFKNIRSQAEIATKDLAQERGEPEWCKSFGRRNTHLLAVAPTVSNSTIAGGYSAGIEPIAANAFAQKSSRGTFVRRNRTFERILDERKKNTPEVWKTVVEQSGSVQHLSCLSDEEKKVFLTAREINQHALVKQAAQRTPYIDQGQSVNLFFVSNSSPKYIHEVHVAAWEQGLKSLYYLRSEGVLKGDLASRSKDECSACEG